jgi:hypothetical protein
MNIRQSRQIWRRAHPVRLPSRDTDVHAELRAAYLGDLIRLKRLEEEIAAKMEAELEEFVCG